jgi:alcohol dehydrogenase (NADP+)
MILTLKQIGAPEDSIPGFNVFALIAKGCSVGGSAIGSPGDIVKMLDFAVKHNVHPYIQERPMKDANQSIVDMDKGNARYRYVLVNEKHAAEEKSSI